MPKVIRYAIGALFFAASVGCLAVLGWIATHSRSSVVASYYTARRGLHFEAINGVAIAWTGKGSGQDGWKLGAREVSDVALQAVTNAVHQHGLFGRTEQWVHFPIWYPALVFALAGVGVLRFRRQFSIRSALIGLAVVAALLGMIVAL